MLQIKTKVGGASVFKYLPVFLVLFTMAEPHEQNTVLCFYLLKLSKATSTFSPAAKQHETNVSTAIWKLGKGQATHQMGLRSS